MILLGRDPHTNQRVELRVDPGATAVAGQREERLEADWLSPALFDIQVNGFAGVDFNDPKVTAQDYRKATKLIWSTGVARYFPTIVTGSRERQLHCLATAARAAEDPQAGPSIAGIHVEGPYISAEDGPRGAHPREFVRPPDRDEFRRFQEAAQGRVRVVTLAPETPGALQFIEWLVGQGVVVSIGHTGASPEQIRAAVSAGARLSTHLGNGCHMKLDRHPNYIWEQLAADELKASMIVDGHHLPPAVVKTFVRAKGVKRCLLVTDASSPAGSPPGNYQLGEVPIELTVEGRVQIRGTTLLAGSALRLDRAVANTVRFAGISLAEALDMASSHPAALLGLEYPHDHVLFDYRDGALKVRATVRQGEVIWR